MFPFQRRIAPCRKHYVMLYGRCKEARSHTHTFSHGLHGPAAYDLYAAWCMCLVGSTDVMCAYFVCMAHYIGLSPIRKPRAATAAAVLSSNPHTKLLCYIRFEKVN